MTWRSGVANSTIFLKFHVQQRFCLLVPMYDHLWKIMSYNVIEKWHNLPPRPWCLAYGFTTFFPGSAEKQKDTVYNLKLGIYLLCTHMQLLFCWISPFWAFAVVHVVTSVALVLGFWHTTLVLVRFIFWEWRDKCALCI